MEINKHTETTECMNEQINQPRKTERKKERKTGEKKERKKGKKSRKRHSGDHWTSDSVRVRERPKKT